MRTGKSGVSNNHHEGHEENEEKKLHALHVLHGKKNPKVKTASNAKTRLLPDISCFTGVNIMVDHHYMLHISFQRCYIYWELNNTNLKI